MKNKILILVTSILLLMSGKSFGQEYGLPYNVKIYGYTKLGSELAIDSVYSIGDTSFHVVAEGIDYDLSGGGSSATLDTSGLATKVFVIQQFDNFADTFKVDTVDIVGLEEFFNSRISLLTTQITEDFDNYHDSVPWNNYWDWTSIYLRSLETDGIWLKNTSPSFSSPNLGFRNNDLTTGIGSPDVGRVAFFATGVNAAQYEDDYFRSNVDFEIGGAATSLSFSINDTNFYANDLISIGSSSATIPDSYNAIYLNTINGDDSNDGFSPQYPKLTFSNALTAAGNLQTANTGKVTLYVNGDIALTTNPTIPDSVDIFAPNSVVSSASTIRYFILSADNDIVVDKFTNASIYGGGSGEYHITANEIVSDTDVAFLGAVNVFLNVGKLGRRLVSSVNSGYSVNVNINKVYTAIGGGSGIYTTGSAKVIGNINEIVCTNSNGRALQAIGNSTIDLNIGRIDMFSDTSWTFVTETGATINTFVNEYEGVHEGTGTLNLTEAGTSGTGSLDREEISFSSTWTYDKFEKNILDTLDQTYTIIPSSTGGQKGNNINATIMFSTGTDSLDLSAFDVVNGQFAPYDDSTSYAVYTQYLGWDKYIANIIRLGVIDATQPGVDTTQLNAPVLTLSSIGDTFAILTWTDVNTDPNETGIDVYYKLQSSGTWLLHDTVVANVVSDTIDVLFPLNSYDFSVIATANLYGDTITDSERSNIVQGSTISGSVDNPIVDDWYIDLYAANANVTLDANDNLLTWTDLSGNGNTGYPDSPDTTIYLDGVVNGEDIITLTGNSRIEIPTSDIYSNDNGITSIWVGTETEQNSNVYFTNIDATTNVIFGRTVGVKATSTYADIQQDWLLNSSDYRVNYSMGATNKVMAIRWLPDSTFIAYENGVAVDTAVAVAKYTQNSYRDTTSFNGAPYASDSYINNINGTLANFKHANRFLSDLEMAKIIDSLGNVYAITTDVTGFSEAVPGFKSAETGVKTDSIIRFYVDGILDIDSIPSTSAFTVSGIASSPSISNISVGSNFVEILLSDTISETDNPTVAYTKPNSGTVLQTPGAYEMNSFTAQSVDNYLFDESGNTVILDATYTNTFGGTKDNTTTWSDKYENGVIGAVKGTDIRSYENLYHGSNILHQGKSTIYTLTELSGEFHSNSTGFTLITTMIPATPYSGKYIIGTGDNSNNRCININKENFILYDGTIRDTVSYTALGQNMCIYVAQWDAVTGDMRVWIDGVEQASKVTSITSLLSQSRLLLGGATQYTSVLGGFIDFGYFGMWDYALPEARLKDIIEKLGYRYGVDVDTSGFP